MLLAIFRVFFQPRPASTAWLSHGAVDIRWLTHLEYHHHALVNTRRAMPADFSADGRTYFDASFSHAISMMAWPARFCWRAGMLGADGRSVNFHAAFYFAPAAAISAADARLEKAYHAWLFSLLPNASRCVGASRSPARHHFTNVRRARTSVVAPLSPGDAAGACRSTCRRQHQTAKWGASPSMPKAYI